MDLQNGTPVLCGRLGDIDKPVEASAPEKRRVDDVRPVRCGKNDHIVQFLDSVHLG